MTILASQQTCGLCLRIRVFLTLAAALVAGIYVQPRWAATLAGLMPDPIWIGVGICSLGMLVFLIRLHRYRRGITGA